MQDLVSLSELCGILAHLERRRSSSRGSESVKSIVTRLDRSLGHDTHPIMAVIFFTVPR